MYGDYGKINVSLHQAEKTVLLTSDKDVEQQETEVNTEEVALPTRVGLIRVAITSAVASIGMMAVGADRAYPSPAIPDLNAHPNPFHVTKEEQSWFVSVSFLGALLGAMLAATLVDRLGRKTTLMLAAVPSLVSWLIILAARSPTVMIAGRMFIGFTNPSYVIVANIYVAEVAPASIRGRLTSMTNILQNVGSCGVYMLGATLHWNWLAVVCFGPPALVTLAMAFLPESPRWLQARGRVGEATKALSWLRGTSQTEAKTEIDRMRATYNNSTERHITPWTAYFRLPLLKPFAVSQALYLLHTFSGINILRIYTVTIFQSAGSQLDPYTQTIVVGVIMVAGSVICSFIIDLFPRRALLIMSTSVMSFGWLAMGAYFFVTRGDDRFATNHLSWLPLLALVVVVFGSSLGIVLLPYIITNEIFSTQARGRAGSMGELTYLVGGFVSCKYFLSLSLLIGNHSMFWLCAGICGLGAVFVFLCVPETRGKHLEDLDRQG